VLNHTRKITEIHEFKNPSLS